MTNCKTAHNLTPTNIIHLIKVKKLLLDIKDSVCGAYDLDDCKSYITDKCDDFTDHIDALLGENK